ncbi:zinc-binding alcohol dehydrogenase family protein [Brevibacillus sp. TJ4]|uniref:zinc-binding alcohol dehydrogenase family protein n=1 Tax=Brevibacillus sp. TJ4 TaxID=3234853 RepID=UPI0037D74830
MSSSPTMKAFGFFKPGPKTEPPPFEQVEVEKPKPAGRDLLVEVRAISVNPTDWRQHNGKDANDDSLTIVGRDVAGVVVEVGSECTLFQVGDEVFYAGSNIRPGGHSQFHLVDERIVGKKPRTLDFAQAAALPLTSITAWEAFFVRLGISRNPADNAGKTLLVIGAAGGVGSVATQLAKLAGLTVIGTASRPETIQWTKEHGSDHTINHHQPFEPQLKELGFPGVHYIFCLTQVDEHMAEMAKVILPQGKICSILPTQKPLDPNLFLKSVTFAFELMYTRPMFQTDDMIEQHRILDELAELVDSGSIRSTMTDHISPINADTLKEAYRKSMSGSAIGKIVLERFEE